MGYDAQRGQPHAGASADLCVILRNDDDLQIGLLFVDSTIPEGFGTDAVAVNVARRLATEEETIALARALERAWRRCESQHPIWRLRVPCNEHDPHCALHV